MKKTLNKIISSLTLIIGLFLFVSCGSKSENNTKDDTKTVVPTPEIVPSVTTSEDPSVPTDVEPIKPVEKTDEEKRQEVLDKANASIKSLENNNFTIKIGNDVYLIDGNNCIKNNIIYEKNTDKYNVYTLKDAEEQSYTKIETTDYSFAEISVGRWNNIFSIADEIRLNRATTESAYVVKKGFSVPEYEIYYTENGFAFRNDDNSIEFYDIGKTEVNIPTNIAKEEEYIIKDGKYNLTNLKFVLEKWFDETDITYQKVFRNVKDIKLINVDNEGLKIYATTDVAEETNLALSILSFKDQDINDLFINKTELNADDFSQRLETVTAKQLTFKSTGLVIDNTYSSSIVKRANWVLENDNVEAEVIWAYENKGDTTLAGNGYGYNMVCFATDGKYYEYAVDCINKIQTQDNYTGTKTKEILVLKDNLELYNN